MVCDVSQRKKGLVGGPHLLLGLFLLARRLLPGWIRDIGFGSGLLCLEMDMSILSVVYVLGGFGLRGGW